MNRYTIDFCVCGTMPALRQHSLLGRNPQKRLQSRRLAQAQQQRLLMIRLATELELTLTLIRVLAGPIDRYTESCRESGARDLRLKRRAKCPPPVARP